MHYVVGIAVRLHKGHIALELDAGLAQQVLGVVEVRQHFQHPVGKLHRTAPEVVVVVEAVGVIAGDDQLLVESVSAPGHPMDGVGDLVLVEQRLEPRVEVSP